jgi:hypothetical protein
MRAGSDWVSNRKALIVISATRTAIFLTAIFLSMAETTINAEPK